MQRRHIDVVDTTGPEAIPDFSPDRLQTLRHIEDKIVCKAYRCLQSTLSLVQDLTKINNFLVNSNECWAEDSRLIQQELQLFEHRLQGQINAVEILGQRVQATLGLVSRIYCVEIVPANNALSSSRTCSISETKPTRGR